MLNEVRHSPQLPEGKASQGLPIPGLVFIPM
jgi:hypothetical protein